MKELTDIVWPEIYKLAQDEIQEAWKEGQLQSKCSCAGITSVGLLIHIS